MKSLVNNTESAQVQLKLNQNGWRVDESIFEQGYHVKDIATERWMTSYSTLFRHIRKFEHEKEHVRYYECFIFHDYSWIYYLSQQEGIRTPLSIFLHQNCPWICFRRSDHVADLLVHFHYFCENFEIVETLSPGSADSYDHNHPWTMVKVQPGEPWLDEKQNQKV